MGDFSELTCCFLLILATSWAVTCIIPLWLNALTTVAFKLVALVLGPSFLDVCFHCLLIMIYVLMHVSDDFLHELYNSSSTLNVKHLLLNMFAPHVPYRILWEDYSSIPCCGRSNENRFQWSEWWLPLDLENRQSTKGTADFIMFCLFYHCFKKWYRFDLDIILDSCFFFHAWEWYFVEGVWLQK